MGNPQELDGWKSIRGFKIMVPQNCPYKTPRERAPESGQGSVIMFSCACFRTEGLHECIGNSKIKFEVDGIVI